MSNFDLDEFSKPKKIRKQKVHREKIYFDDDVDEVRVRKQAGKRKHSRSMNEYGLDDEEDLEQFKHLLR